MLTAIAILMSAPVATNCGPFNQAARHHWVKGSFNAIPADPASQADALRRLGRRSVKAIDVVFARSITRDGNLPAGPLYYLARAGYLGKMDQTALPRGMALSVDVDARGTAYITSFRLTHELTTSALAVVLITDRKILKAVAICGAAD